MGGNGFPPHGDVNMRSGSKKSITAISGFGKKKYNCICFLKNRKFRAE